MYKNRLYRKTDYYKVEDGLFSGLRKLFGRDKKERRDFKSNYNVGDRIKFERQDGRNATGVVESVYYNNQDNAVDYGVHTSGTLDNIVVPEENIESIIDSKIRNQEINIVKRY